MSGYHNNSIFWVEVEKIGPNPFQPRREFEPGALEDLADSIRQYGVLQPLVVTRKEEQTENGGISVFYELIAGERRLRAARLADLQQVPVIIRKGTDDKVKLELAIIENLQREDLNPIDRALAFEQLYKQFNLTHAEIGKKMGKSRVYVSNSLRLLSLPEEIKQGLMAGRITEGHTRPLLMLSDKPEEQSTLYKEITLKKMSVRESEKVARSIAQDKIRKQKFAIDPRIREFEKRLSDNLGTRVSIEQKEKGGKITIDYFTVKDLEGILDSIKKVEYSNGDNMMDNYINKPDEDHSAKHITQSNPIDFISGKVEVADTEETIQKQVSEPVVKENILQTEEQVQDETREPDPQSEESTKPRYEVAQDIQVNSYQSSQSEIISNQDSYRYQVPQDNHQYSHNQAVYGQDRYRQPVRTQNAYDHYSQAQPYRPQKKKSFLGRLFG